MEAPCRQQRPLENVILRWREWETDFYTPPVLGCAALLPFSAPAVYKTPVP